MSSDEQTGGQPLVRILILIVVGLVVLTVAAGGAGAGLLHLSRSDDDLAARLENVPVLSQFLPAPVEEVQELTEIERQQTLLSLKRSELDARERELSDRESAVAAGWDEVTALAAELEAELQELQKLKQRLDGRAADIERLIEVYRAMKPAAVAEIVSELDDDLAVVILAGLDQRQAARVMEELDRELAANYTRLLGTDQSGKGGDDR